MNQGLPRRGFALRDEPVTPFAGSSRRQKAGANASMFPRVRVWGFLVHPALCPCDFLTDGKHNRN
jgi:hypothetical protein